MRNYTESANAQGKYIAVLISPREGKRDKCVKIVTRIAKLEKYVDYRIIGYFVKKIIDVLQARYNSLTYVVSTDTFKNVVCNEGKNWMLDVALGTSVAVVGPYMGLISSVGYTGIPVVGDTMASHASANHVWVEAGSSTNYPLYTGTRKTCVWSAATAGGKALSAALSFVCVTTGGTVKGCFVVFGTGAVSTIADTNGYLWSAGVFSGGDKVMQVADTLQVSYNTTL